jgi:hypothetical protein
MYEFTELQALSDHACTNPQHERLEVYEPVRMQWHWVSLFECCSQVYSEPAPDVEAPWRPKAVQVAA